MKIINALVLLCFISLTACGGGGSEEDTRQTVSSLSGSQDQYAEQKTGPYKEKTCTFETQQALESPYRGCYSKFTLSFKDAQGKSTPKNICQQPYAGPDWLSHILMDGHAKKTDAQGEDYFIMNGVESLYWRSSQVPVKQVIRKRNSVSYGYAVFPRVQMYNDKTSSWDYMYPEDTWSVLFLQKSDDNWAGIQGQMQFATQQGTGRGAYFFEDKSQLAVFTTRSDKYRQVWVENTPGDHCQAKGTVLVK